MRARRKASALLFQGALPPPAAWPLTIVVALVTAATVIVAHGGNAFWICVPAGLLAAGRTRTRLGAAIAAGSVLASAYATAQSLPSPALALPIVGASVGVLVSVRERLEREHATLRRFALTDALTGLANRRSLLHRIDYEIARHTRARTQFAVLMLDLDGFKALNDRFGHAAGDELLIDVARALTNAVREQDTVARIGGDEFCVLAPETELEGALRLSERAEDAVADLTSEVHALGVSCGVAMFPDDGISPAAVLDVADQRLLGAKRGRRGARAYRRAA